MKTASTLLVAYLAVASAVPLATNHVVHEKRDTGLQSRWIKRDAVPGATRLPVRIALKQRNLDKGMDLLLEV